MISIVCGSFVEDQLYPVKQVLTATVIELLPCVSVDLNTASGDQGHRDALEVKV